MDCRITRQSSGDGKASVFLAVADALDELPKIQTHTVDLFLTDGPYPEIDRPYGRLTEDEWFVLMQAVVQEARRIVKPSGSAVFLMQPNYSHVGVTRLWPWRFLVWAGDFWNLVEDVYWNAPDTVPSAGTDRKCGLLKRAGRPIVWLGAPDCYRRQDAVLKRPSPQTREKKIKTRKGPSGYSRDDTRMWATMMERGGCVPTNVLTIPLSGGSPGSNGHPAVLPYAVADWLVKYLLPPGGTLLDCFCGSGTVLEAGLRNQAGTVIGIDKVPEYIVTCQERLQEHL